MFTVMVTGHTRIIHITSATQLTNYVLRVPQISICSLTVRLLITWQVTQPPCRFSRAELLHPHLRSATPFTRGYHSAVCQSSLPPHASLLLLSSPSSSLLFLHCLLLSLVLRYNNLILFTYASIFH